MRPSSNKKRSPETKLYKRNRFYNVLECSYVSISFATSKSDKTKREQVEQKGSGYTPVGHIFLPLLKA